MTQVRIVVSPKVLPTALRLMEITQVGNLSDLFALLVSRYGGHLLQTWSVTTVEKSVVMPLTSPQLIYTEKFQESVDPEIARISKFIEEF